MRRWLKPDAIKNCKLERPWTLFEHFQPAELFNEVRFDTRQTKSYMRDGLHMGSQQGEGVDSIAVPLFMNPNYSETNKLV